MSLTLRILKITAIISFLIIPGLDENGVPNFAFLSICLFQFFHDIFHDSIIKFWEGIIVIPILGSLVYISICKSYKILIFCFLILFIPFTYATGIIDHYDRIDFWFVFTYGTFIITSIAVIVLAQKEEKIIYKNRT